MFDKDDSIESINKRLSRRNFLKASVGAGIGLGLGSIFLSGCAAPAQLVPPKETSAASPVAKSPAKEASSAPEAAPKTLKKVTFAAATMQTGSLAMVIKNRKIDQKYGLDLDINMFPNPDDAAKAVVLKRVDVGIISPIAAASAVNEGMPIVIFSPMLWTNSFVTVAKDSPFRDVKDLKGKKIGSLGNTSGNYTSSQVIFKELGMDFEKDFQIITGPPAAIVAFLQRKEVDAIILSDPYAMQLEASGSFRPLASLNDMWKGITGQPMFFIGIGTNRDWFNQNQSTAQAVLKAVLEGGQYAIDHPEVVEADEVKEVLGLKTAEEIAMYKPRYAPFMATRWDDNTLKNAQLVLQRAVDLKVINKLPTDPVLVIP